MTIQSYDTILEKLVHPQKKKITKLIQLGCIERINDDLYICKPITGYNKTAYSLKHNHIGDFECNCQSYRFRRKCSHSAALGIILLDKQKQGVLL